MRSIRVIKQIYVSTYIGCLASHLSGTCAWLQPVFQEPGASRLIALRQSGPRPDPRLLRQTALEVLTRSARSDSPQKLGRNEIPAKLGGGGGGGGDEREEKGGHARVITDQNFYNCGRPGYFIADCNRPKKDDKNKDDRLKKDDRRSLERRRTRSDKRPNGKNDRKVLFAEEINKNWADSDSDTTSRSTSSSDSEPEEVHCLMANQSTHDEVFVFSNTEFTREDLINAQNEMVHEYRKLSQTFEEIKSENGCFKISSIEPSTAQLGDSDSLQTELSKLKIENESLRNKSCELTSENERLNEVMMSGLVLTSE
ncbi:hypothetical protein F511_32788 [Dorcoceras hygrometricum]|uniref:CCHC-type domain-containing protein n=1 Tax=Dorcoceras hygrometricum TaxID=472368 RepID=A0A2Z7BTN9_9LAMI|nr:hypothetical protein F511_32788 [Dorcoceras hygrometricum]